MKQIQFMINQIKSFFILLIAIVVNSVYPVENRNLFGFPTFAIYAGKTPVYATLSGSFTFYPEKEMQKIESFLKTSNSKVPVTIRHGSSYLTIKYENTIYKFHELDNIQSEWNIEGGNISISGQIPKTNVEIFVIIKNKESKQGTFIVSYKAINRTNRIVDIGFRSLIDIGPEDNDGIPLKICTDNASEKEVYSNEFKFTPYKSNYWETYETETDSMIGIRNNMIEPNTTPPDQIAFVNWGKGYLSDWKYFTNKNLLTNNDSAVMIWWNPRPVKVGETMEISTEYEIKKPIKEGVFFDLVNPEIGTGKLHIKAVNNSDMKKEFSYELDAGENAVLSLNANNPLKFIVEKNSILDKIIPLSLHGKGEINFSVKERQGKVETTHSLPVRLTQENRDQSPKFWKSSKYPIIYNSNQDGLRLKGIVRARDSGKKLGETELISVKSIQNSFVYLGEVDIKEFNGEVLVEIFKK